MEDLSIFRIQREYWKEASGFLTEEVCETLRIGLPVLVMGAAVGDSVVGALAGSIDQEIFDISSLFVTPAARRCGVGTALMNALEDLLSEVNNCLAVHAAYTRQSKDNHTLEPFFNSLGFREDRLRFPVYYASDLKKTITHFSNVNIKGIKLLSFEETPEDLLSALNVHASMAYLPVPEGGLLSDEIDRALSFCVSDKKKILAYAVTENDEDGMIILSDIWSGLDDPAVVNNMRSLQVTGLKEKYPRQTTVNILALDVVSEEMILNFFPEARSASRCYIKQVP